MKIFFGLLIICFVFCSCYEVPCRDNLLKIAFVNFSHINIDSIVIRTYNKDSNFIRMIDSSGVYASSFGSNEHLGYTVKDTTFIDLNLAVDYDYEVYLPTLNKGYKITNIVSEHREGKRNCFNAIYSCNINGNESIPKFYSPYYYYYSVTGYYIFIYR